MNTPNNSIEAPVTAKELQEILKIHPNTLRLKIKAGAIPQPDVKISTRLRYWKRETLRSIGLLPQLEGGAA